MIRLTERARAALREDEVIVADWAALSLCCGCAGEAWLRPARRHLAARRRGFRQLPADPAGSVLAHPLAAVSLAGREVVVDCRTRLGLRHFSCDAPDDSGLAGLTGLAGRRARGLPAGGRA